MAWSELPPDIFRMIAEQLTFLDHVRLSCVCLSWRSVVRSNNFRPVPQIPWLRLPHSMIPGEPHRDHITVDFLSLSDRKIFEIPLPDPPLQNWLNIGSSVGWLIVADSSSELHLWNPFTGSQINLPPAVETLGRVAAAEQHRVGKQTPARVAADDIRHYLYVKAICAPSSESSTDDYTVVLIYNPHRRLAFAKAGDDSWTTLPETSRGFRDVIHHKGEFYTLDRYGNVEAWDLSGPIPKSTFLAPKFEEEIYGDVKYLVESYSGDLLQVHRSSGWFDCGFHFKLFKMDLPENEWVLVEEVGNEALFLGCSHSMSLSQVPELRQNRIYFTGSLSDRHDAGIYNLLAHLDWRTSRFEEFFGSKISSYKSSLPIWITPRMF